MTTDPNANQKQDATATSVNLKAASAKGERRLVTVLFAHRTD